MRLEKLRYDLTVCQVKDLADVNDFLFLSKTDKELSVVCETAKVQENTINREDGWMAFRVEGSLEFSLVGILADLSHCLADAGISIFAVSTYDTDYILVKKDNWDKAKSALLNAGYEITEALL